MFEELVETQPHRSSGTNRKSYFLVSGAVLFFGLTGALIFSLFAVDLSLDMNDMDMVELVAPVDTTPPEKLPEPETAPKEQPKSQPGPSAAPRMTMRQAIVASLDESPREAPTAVSTVLNSEKARPTNGYVQIGKFDADGTPDGVAGRGPGGTGTGDGTGGLGDGTALAKVETNDEPPPPVKKDPPAPKKPLVLSMGVVNGKATSLPKPDIPVAAKTANAAGTVSVQVLIDEKGNVISANAVSGNILLRSASESAAKIAKFSPTLLSGSPTKVSGIINYHFS
ncbi:MAG TPA: energy transducer TonB [Pyrinomonadaceae bacterium]|nr:energy transducer TonB [Acidobacteriota bacterium]HQZ95856.1 energy transducer TonB [Pyrinomonadaceae bacterium]